VVVEKTNGSLVARVSSEHWAECAHSVKLELDGDVVKRNVPVSHGRFAAAIPVSNGDTLSVGSVCNEGSTSKLTSWSTTISSP
jgi:hypothetical protein